MRITTKLAACFAPLALAACSGGTPDAHLEGKCSLVRGAAGQDVLKVQDEFGGLLMVGDVTKQTTTPSVTTFEARNTLERAEGLNITDPLAPTQWVRAGGSAKLTLPTGDCVMSIGDRSFSVSMKGDFKLDPRIEAQMPGEATIRTMNGLPIESRLAPDPSERVIPMVSPMTGKPAGSVPAPK